MVSIQRFVSLATRLMGAIACAALLSGCLYDGFLLPASWQVSQADATEPVPDRAVFYSGAQDTPIYSRFIKAGANRYMWELHAGTAQKSELVVLEASFTPVANGWHMLHWRPISAEAQGVHLVRFDGNRMAVAEVSRLDDALIQRSAAAQGLQAIKQPASTTISLRGESPQRLMPLLQGIARLPQLRAQTHERVAGVPQALRAVEPAALAEHITLIDRRETRDPAQADRLLAYFRALHAEGSGLGSYGYARFANNGWGMAIDLPLARTLAETAISRGVPQAHTLLGYMAYFGSGEAVNHLKAVQHFERAAQAGDGRAFHGLALAASQGHGVRKDPAHAAALFEKAANKGLSLSRVALADLYLEGNGVAKDDARAATLADDAVAAQHPMGYELRAWMHAAGRGGPKDDAAASRLYLLAAQDNLPFSQWQIGERMVAGTGIRADRAGGLQWIEKAANAGHADAAKRLTALRAQPAAPASEEFWVAMEATLQAEAKAAQKSLDSLNQKGTQLNQEIETLARSQRNNILSLRKLMKNELKLVGLYAEGIAIEQRLIANRNEYLTYPLPADKRAEVIASRAENISKLNELRTERANLMAKSPAALAFRLPSGQLVLSRPDGQWIAVKGKIASGIDTRTLPRKGDQQVRGGSAQALVDYEQSWTGVPPQDARMAGLAKNLNTLAGKYQCRVKTIGGLGYAARPSGGFDPQISVDVHKVLRHITDIGDGSAQGWFERQTFMPLSKASEIELQDVGRSDTCAIVVVRCNAPAQACADTPSDKDEVSTSVGVSFFFANEAAARQGMQDLRELMRLAR